MSLTVYVNGVDRTSYFSRRQLSFDRRVNAIGILRAVSNDKTGTVYPSIGSDVVVEDVNRTVSDGNWLLADAANVVKSSTASFAAGDVGKPIVVQDGVSATFGYPLQTTIASVVSSTQITTADNRLNTATSSGKSLRILNRRYFGGIVSGVRRSGIIDDKGLRAEISVSDYSVIAKRFHAIFPIIYAATNEQTVVNVFLSYFDKFVSPQAGVILTSSVPTTAVQAFRIDGSTNIFDALTSFATGRNKIWFIDELRRLTYEAPGATSSGVTFTSSNSTIRNIVIEDSLTNWATQAVMSIGRSGDLEWVDYPLVTSGIINTATKWRLPYEIEGPPAYVTLDGVIYPVGSSGSGSDWTWQQLDYSAVQSGFIYLTYSGAALTTGLHTATVRLLAKFPSVFYFDQPNFGVSTTPGPNPIDGDGSSSPSTSTYTQEALVDLPGIYDAYEASAMGNAYITNHNKSMTAVTISCRDIWVKPNQTATITFSKYGLSGTYYCLGLEASVMIDGKFELTYQFVSSTAYADFWADFFKR